MEIRDLFMDENGLRKVLEYLIEFRTFVSQGNIPNGYKNSLFDQCDGIMDNSYEIKRLIELNSK